MLIDHLGTVLASRDGSGAVETVGYTDSLTVRAAGSSQRVRIHLAETTERAIADATADGADLGLSSVELTAWIAFCARYYREGVAEVDHLDLEATWSDARGPALDFVLRVGRAKPPMSEEEVRRLLGLGAS